MEFWDTEGRAGFGLGFPLSRFQTVGLNAVLILISWLAWSEKHGRSFVFVYWVSHEAWGTAGEYLLLQDICDESVLQGQFIHTSTVHYHPKHKFSDPRGAGSGGVHANHAAGTGLDSEAESYPAFSYTVRSRIH
jgi:Zn-dependent M28 family amino/carboxypeptidase